MPEFRIEYADISVTVAPAPPSDRIYAIDVDYLRPPYRPTWRSKLRRGVRRMTNAQKAQIVAVVIAFIIALLNVFGINVPSVPAI